MRLIILAMLLSSLFSGCQTKTLTVSGMVCPPGHSEQMVHSDFSECRAYDEKKADLATFPKSVTPECKECLLKRGYSIDK